MLVSALLLSVVAKPWVSYLMACVAVKLLVSPWLACEVVKILVFIIAGICGCQNVGFSIWHL
jgi:hypothetical protein